jgi:hypothetical protein
MKKNKKILKTFRVNAVITFEFEAKDEEGAIEAAQDSLNKSISDMTIDGTEFAFEVVE